MTRFIATRLDLSRLQAVKPALILDLDYEALLDARLATLQARLPAVDTLGNEHNPMVALQQEDAYRQLLDYGLLNDRVRGLLAAFASGTDLDHVVARAAISRLVLTRDDAGAPLSYEDDDTLRMRYFASFGAPSAGSDDAYIFNTLTAYPSAHHVYALGPSEHGVPGQVDVVVTAPGGVDVPIPTLDAIRRTLSASNVRPLTDTVNVIAATVAPYTVMLTADILRGPDPVALRDQIVANLQRVTGERYRGGGEVPRAALMSAAFDAGAVSVSMSSPAADIPRAHYTAPFCAAIKLSVQERLGD